MTSLCITYLERLSLIQVSFVSPSMKDNPSGPQGQKYSTVEDMVNCTCVTKAAVTCKFSFFVFEIKFFHEYIDQVNLESIG